ncbi:MAG: hypothetical protein SFV17_21780 [Candidatus Obscuribacter sp.]|nr:hypothetical protein [Candidatus Melainabacteria bacterium]MDX1989332.1 hypothetical protein [Candidatus Obscuribacter sp.]
MAPEKEPDEEMKLVLSANANSAAEAGTPKGSASEDKPAFKVKLSLKLAVFVMATITLSWFFEGWRQVSEAPTLAGLAYLFGGTTLTIVLVSLYGFFMYAEERSKGGRTRNIPLFDRWYRHLTKQGDKTNRG